MCCYTSLPLLSIFDMTLIFLNTLLSFFPYSAPSSVYIVSTSSRSFNVRLVCQQRQIEPAASVNITADQMQWYSIDLSHGEDRLWWWDSECCQFCMGLGKVRTRCGCIHLIRTIHSAITYVLEECTISVSVLR